MLKFVGRYEYGLDATSFDQIGTRLVAEGHAEVALGNLATVWVQVGDGYQVPAVVVRQMGQMRLNSDSATSNDPDSDGSIPHLVANGLQTSCAGPGVGQSSGSLVAAAETGRLPSVGILLEWSGRSYAIHPGSPAERPHGGQENATKLQGRNRIGKPKCLSGMSDEG